MMATNYDDGTIIAATLKIDDNKDAKRDDNNIDNTSINVQNTSCITSLW